MSDNIKGKDRQIPTCCKDCGNYLPQFYRIIATKECAAFVTCEGVKNNSCGAKTKRVEAPKYR